MYYKFKLFGRKYKLNVNTRSITSGWGNRYQSYPFFPFIIKDNEYGDITINIGLFKTLHISSSNELYGSNAKGYAGALQKGDSQFESFKATMSNLVSMMPIRFIDKDTGIININGRIGHVHIIDNTVCFTSRNYEESFFTTFDCRSLGNNRLLSWPNGTIDDIFNLAMTIDIDNASVLDMPANYQVRRTGRDKWYVSSLNGREIMRRIWDQGKKWIGVWPEFDTREEAIEFMNKLKHI